MLILEIKREEIIKPLQLATKATTKRSPDPILSCVVLKNEGGRLSLWATDTEIQINVSNIENTSPDFAFAVNGSELQLYLNNFADGDLIEFDLDDSLLTLRSGKGNKYSLPTCRSTDLDNRRIKIDTEVIARFSLTQKDLLNGISQVHYAIATQDVRSYLMGLLMQANQEVLNLVATDGHRIAVTKIAIDANIPDSELIVPRKTVGELKSLLSGNNDLITIEFYNRHLRFSFENVELVSKILDGKFPDYERIMPKDNEIIFELDRAEFLGKLQNIKSVLESDQVPGIIVQVTDNNLLITARGEGAKSGQETISMIYPTEQKYQFPLNAQYLIDVLQNLKCETIRMAFSQRSVLFTIPDDDKFRSVVMTMRF